MTALPPLLGHEDLRRSLGATARRGELTPAILFHGPAGIGKQRLALWLARLLVCAEGGAAPCDQCRPCRLARQLEHPDVHWFFPLPRPKVSGGPDRLGEALEDLRAEELASRRANPLYATGSAETTGIYLAHVQVIRRMAAAKPAMGSRKVFIIGDAEALVPQEASPEAANALLKLLEEPPADTTVLLTAADPEVLLPTIRSRLLPVRVRPLPEADVAAFLESQGTPAAQAAVVARLSQGAIGRAIAIMADEGEGSVRGDARALLEAAIGGTPAARLLAAHAQAPAGARAGYAAVLEQMALWLRDLGAVATGADDLVVNVDGLDWLRRGAARLGDGGAGIPDALRALDEATRLIQFNINPQLAMNALLRELATALRTTGAATGRR